MSSAPEVARRGLRIAYEYEELTEQMENGVRVAHRHVVTADGDESYLLKVLALGTGAAATISLTSYLLKTYFGEILRPVASNCVIFEITVSKNNVEIVEKIISDGTVMRGLQGDFFDIANRLRDILGENFDRVDCRVIEHLSKTKITSLEMCSDEALKSAWKKFWKREESISTISQRVEITPEKISEIFDGKISESKIEKILDKLSELGVQSQTNMARLTESDISREFEDALNLVELRELMAFVEGFSTSLPPINLRLSVCGYPNSALAVFFDDPNELACDYLITAEDMESTDTVEMQSDSNYGVLRNLMPGRKYVVSAQCVRNGIKSKKSYFSEPVNVFGDERNDCYAWVKKAEEPAADIAKDSQLATSIGGSYSTTYLLESSVADNMPTKTGLWTKRRVSSAKESLTETTERSVHKGRIGLSGTPVHRKLRDVFPAMDELSMNSLLAKCEDVGIENARDFRYFLKPEVADEFKGTLKIVEIMKLLEHVRKLTEIRWAMFPEKKLGPVPTKKIPHPDTFAPACVQTNRNHSLHAGRQKRSKSAPAARRDRFGLHSN